MMAACSGGRNRDAKLNMRLGWIHLNSNTEMNMPNINTMTGSTYLKQQDVTPPKVFTIKDLRQENLARDDQPAKMKWIMYFQEIEKGLALNSTNIKRCAKALQAEDTEDWIGKKIKLYFDENVEFGGQLVGGIRITRAGTAKPPVDDVDDEIPF